MIKKIIALTAILLCFGGCDNMYVKSPEYFEDLQKPCIVIAIKKRDADAGFHGGHGSIILKDAKGFYLTLDGNSYDGGALVASYNLGDTIK